MRLVSFDTSSGHRIKVNPDRVTWLGEETTDWGGRLRARVVQVSVHFGGAESSGFVLDKKYSTLDVEAMLEGPD